MDPPSLSQANHVVQVALTPVFMLTGIASLLSVFTTRLGRVADRVDRLSEMPKENEAELRRLKLRSRMLDVAVLFAALAGALTCAAAFILFVGVLNKSDAAALLLGLFGGALVAAVGALGAFSVETILSGRSIRAQAQGEGAEGAAGRGTGAGRETPPPA